MELDLSRETERLTTEIRYVIKASIKEDVPLSKIREAVGAGKNWRTWQKFKRRVGLEEGK